MAGGGSGSWLVPDGVQSTDVEPVVAQRWLQHRRDDFFGRGGIGPQSQHSGKSTDTVESRGTAGVFDLIEPVIGGRFEMAHDGGPLRGDEDGGVPARGVDQCHVVRLRDGNPPPVRGGSATDLRFLSSVRAPSLPFDGYSSIVSCPKSPRPAKATHPERRSPRHGRSWRLPGSEIQSRLSGRNGSRVGLTATVMPRCPRLPTSYVAITSRRTGHGDPKLSARQYSMTTPSSANGVTAVFHIRRSRDQWRTLTLRCCATPSGSSMGNYRRRRLLFWTWQA